MQSVFRSAMNMRLLPALLLAALLTTGPACARITLSEGDSAPDFTLKTESGKPLTLSQVWQETVVVLYFYPMDDTPGCRVEACAFRDLNESFLEVGARVLGVSVDDVVSHQRFTDKYNLNFTLLADPDATVTRSYGVQSRFMLGKAARMTFVIDRQGIIRKIYPDVDVRTHSSEVLAYVKTLTGK